MKLSEKYNRLNIATTILIFIVGSFSFYFLINYILVRELDDDLKSEQEEIVTAVSLHNSLPEIIPTKDEYTLYEPTGTKGIATFATIRKKYDGEEEDFREIRFTVNAAGKYYSVRVGKPLEGTEALIQIIILVTIVMIGLILLAAYIINRVVLGRLWKPFYQTIDKIRAYHLSGIEAFKLDRVDIDEFLLLNLSIEGMVARIQDDYSTLKNFSGQAAHEMQTPLAIIRSRVDMLMQNEAILENVQGIPDIEKAVHRLSKLHQSLLLLTKVENKQFVLNEQIRMDKVILDKCHEYTEMLEAMNITLTSDIYPTTILFHNHLADILINNLVNNAVRYNKQGGSIHIELSNNKLVIGNTSVSGSLNTEQLFLPFYREHTSKEGTGLGLSIVKQVCDTAGYKTSYEYTNNRHVFSILFN